MKDSWVNVNQTGIANIVAARGTLHVPPEDVIEPREVIKLVGVAGILLALSFFVRLLDLILRT